MDFIALAAAEAERAVHTLAREVGRACDLQGVGPTAGIVSTVVEEIRAAKARHSASATSSTAAGAAAAAWRMPEMACAKFAALLSGADEPMEVAHLRKTAALQRALRTARQRAEGNDANGHVTLKLVVSRDDGRSDDSVARAALALATHRGDGPADAAAAAAAGDAYRLRILVDAGWRLGALEAAADFGQKGTHLCSCDFPLPFAFFVKHVSAPLSALFQIPSATRLV